MINLKPFHHIDRQTRAFCYHIIRYAFLLEITGYLYGLIVLFERGEHQTGKIFKCTVQAFPVFLPLIIHTKKMWNAYGVISGNMSRQ